MKEKTAASTPKIVLHCEAVYLIALILQTVSLSMSIIADLGISAFSVPPYVLSLRTGISNGQCVWIVQAFVLVIFCLIMGRFRPVYLAAFVTDLIYGVILDLVQRIPCLNPSVILPGSPSLPVRVLLFCGSELIMAFSVALFFRIYLYPSLTDLFAKGICSRFHLSTTKGKLIFDISYLAFAAAMPLILLHTWTSIGIGTVVIAVINGPLIGLFDKLLGRYVDFRAIFRKGPELFSLKEEAGSGK